MAEDSTGSSAARSVLMAEFDSEVARLVDAAASSSPVEGVMRVRALADVAAMLSTESLLRLARDLSDLSSPTPNEPLSVLYRQSGCA